MAKVTSKLQVTIPKAIAEEHGLEPGMEVDFESAGETVRMQVRRRKRNPDSELGWRLRSFDEATEQQRVRNERFRAEHADLMKGSERGWTREELYARGPAR